MRTFMFCSDQMKWMEKKKIFFLLVTLYSNGVLLDFQLLSYLTNISSVVYAFKSSLVDVFIIFTNPFNSANRLAVLAGLVFNSKNISSTLSCFLAADESSLL